MATKSTKKLATALARRLRLLEPEFHLERLGGKVSGSVISDSFRGVKSRDRQRRIWDALEREFGDDSRDLVGILLAYTRAEWNIPLEGDPSNGKKPKKTKQA